MIIVLKKKTLATVAVVSAAFISAAVLISLAGKAASAAPRFDITVVVDAGHGGADGGVTGGVTGVKESDLNLAVARKLRDDFANFGFKTAMTRDGEGGLYGWARAGRKRRDMEARKKTIEACEPAAVISIHMNSFPQKYQRGAQIFYNPASEESEALARDVYAVVSKGLPASDRPVLAGDYYVLNCHKYPAILVECGFLSNAEDERLLITPEYREKVAYNIFSGVLDYISERYAARLSSAGAEI